MTKANRKSLERMEVEIRRRVKEFWEQFSNDELEALLRGDADEELIAKLDAGEKVLALYRAIMTPEERAELKRVEMEIIQREKTKNDKF